MRRRDQEGRADMMLEAPALFLLPPRRTRDHSREAVGELDRPATITRATDWLRNYAPEAIENAAGDQTTFRVAAGLKDMGISEPVCLELMEGWNEVKAHPPWSPEELEIKVANAYAYGSAPIGVASTAEFEPVDIEVIPPTPEEKARTKLFWRRHDEARQRYLTGAVAPLIDKYLGRGEMSVLYGDSNTGKTFVALDWAYHIAMRRSWNGHRVHGGLVVYVAAEAGESINARLEALYRRYKPEAEPLLAVVPCLVNLYSPNADLKPLLALLDEIAKAYGQPIMFVVLDTLARVIGPGDENSARDMGILVQAVDRIRVATGAHVQLIHHSGKNKANGARGSSALRAATDTELEIEGGRIYVRKQRNGEQISGVGFRLVPADLGKNEAGDMVTSCTIEIGAPVEFEIQFSPQEEWIEQLRKYQDDHMNSEFTTRQMAEAWGLMAENGTPVSWVDAKNRTKYRRKVLLEGGSLEESGLSDDGEKVFWLS